MTNVILTRHGHVDWIAPERFRGRAELPLSELGKRQAEALGRRVAEGWKPTDRCDRASHRMGAEAVLRPPCWF